MPPTWLGIFSEVVFVTCLSGLFVVGLKRLIGSATMDQEAELVFQLRLRVRSEISAENQIQLLRALALIDAKRASVSFLSAFAGSGAVPESARAEAAAILRSWDPGGIVGRAEAVVEGIFEKES